MDDSGRYWDHREARWAESARSPGETTGEWLPTPREPVEPEDLAEEAEELEPAETAEGV